MKPRSVYASAQGKPTDITTASATATINDSLRIDSPESDEIAERGLVHVFQEPVPNPETRDEPVVPHWDEERRELRLGGVVVKRFRQPAPSQEIVLKAFEEDGWPPYLDDPFTGVPGVVPKQRLHAVIDRLNRHQIKRLIRFRGNGTGCTILWELITDQATTERR